VYFGLFFRNHVSSLCFSAHPAAPPPVAPVAWLHGANAARRVARGRLRAQLTGLALRVVGTGATMKSLLRTLKRVQELGNAWKVLAHQGKVVFKGGT
jgi:hypothetical protein